ncbi:MAG: DegT/DnrJ/EryC1/StrS family aminotransferase [Planctomycetota bacterium]
MARDPVQQFEAAFARYQGAAAARAFWMGRVGLYAVLRSLGVEGDDRVGICAYTCMSVVEAVTRLGAVPVFLDVDRHLNIASASLERLGEPLAALILQHTFGVPCDLDACLAWAAARGVPVIEDCCHALGATWNGQLVGRFGCAAVFSFQWGKPFSTGQGGMVTFPQPDLVREVDRVIARDAIAPRFLESASLGVQCYLYRWFVTPGTRACVKSMYHWACRHGLVAGSEPRSECLVGMVPGFLKLASPGQARAGLQQLRRWPHALPRRREAAAAIHAKLQQEGLEFVQPDRRAAPMYLRCPVWVRRKTDILDAAERARLDIAGWYISAAHPLPGKQAEELGYVPAACPNAEEAFARVVTLPTAPPLTPVALDRTMRIIVGPA